MRQLSKGFTLVELLIVLVVIAIVASIAIPNVLGSRITANEATTIGTLKSIMSSQAQVKAAGNIDGNRNGVGEYGYFQELSGARAIRTGSPPVVVEGLLKVSPPALSGAFGQVTASGPYASVARGGYMFLMALPGAGASFILEPSPSAAYGQVDPVWAENYWLCIAWPLTYRNSGRRIFFVNQTGEILQASNVNTQWSGFVNAMPIESAMLPGVTVMSGTVAINATGTDGNRWTALQ